MKRVFGASRLTKTDPRRNHFRHLSDMPTKTYSQTASFKSLYRKRSGLTISPFSRLFPPERSRYSTKTSQDLSLQITRKASRISRLASNVDHHW